MSYLASNLSLLSRRQSELAQALKEVEYNRIKVFDSVRGGPTAIFKRDTSELSLHSRYEPMKEARQRLKRIDCGGSDYFIFLGFGLGYLMDALLETCADTDCHYFIVESDLEILKAAFDARDLGTILSLENIHFAWPVTGPKLAEQWSQFFDPVHSKGSTFLTHLPSVSLNPDLFKTAAEIIQSQTHQIFTDINTLVEKSEVFLENFIQNIHAASSSPGVSQFAGKFSDTPAVIISAGPSLDKNIYDLKGFEDRVVMLSTDTALKPLLAAGIEPHFILTGDPYHKNYLHLEGAEINKSMIVAEATSYPEVFRHFANRVIACTYDNSSLHSLSDLLGEKGILRAWGSVATMALDFALLLGCNPVIFAGQDLAHTGGRIYCSGLYFEKEWYNGITDPEKWQERLTEMRASRRTVLSEDIFGNPIESTDKLMAYWNWMLKEIQSHPEITFINATEGGILKEGVEIISLKEALYCYGSEPLNLTERIGKIFAGSKMDRQTSDFDLSILTRETTTVERILNRGMKLCKFGAERSPVDLRNSLENLKENIYLNTHVAPLLDNLNQMGNVNFLRRCKELADHTPGKDPVPEMKSIYREYFASLQKALGKIQKAVKQIHKNLSRS